MKRNVLIMLAVDIFLVTASYYFSYWIRFEFSIQPIFLGFFSRTLPYVILVKIGTFIFFGLYRGVWRYTSMVDIVNVLKASATSSLVIVFIVLMLHRFQGYPRSVFIIDAILTFLAVGGFRMGIRLYFARSVGTQLFPALSRMRHGKERRLLIIGAGDAGEMVLREIQDTPGLKFIAVGFLDDDPNKQGMSIHGVPVLGDVNGIKHLNDAFDEILIAVPSAPGEDMRRIVDTCEKTGKPFRTLPGMRELIDGKVSVKTVRNVTLEDLLGREELHLDQEEIARYIRRKRVLVTGAGGSIGSELVRQIGRFSPGALAMIEISELNLFRVEMECRQRFGYLPIHAYLTDIRNRDAVKRVFQTFKPQVVFHAAAYKHVPIQEVFPWEAVNNNILGTINLVEIANEAKVETFVLVSTDKAVRPTNVMGATKRVAEMVLEGINGNAAGSRFMAVRFGNVMGSSGSAIPVFQEQIARGGPVTVTHPEVTRYFMSVGEAAQLILQAGALGHGGEIFILDMGRPIKIVDMARDLIRLHGFEPEKDIPISFIGLRPGEKLYEELITEGEGIVPTDHKKILVLKGNSVNYQELGLKIEELLNLAPSFNERAIKAKLQEIVPEYTPCLDE